MIESTVTPMQGGLLQSAVALSMMLSVCGGRTLHQSSSSAAPAAQPASTKGTSPHLFVASGGDALTGVGEDEVMTLCTSLERSKLFSCTFAWGSGAQGSIAGNSSKDEVRSSLAELSGGIDWFVGNNDRMINPEYDHTVNPVPQTFQGWFTYEQSVVLFKRQASGSNPMQRALAPSLVSPRRPITIAKILNASRKVNVGGGQLNDTESVLPSISDDTMTKSARAQTLKDTSDQARETYERTLVAQHQAPKHLGTLSTYSKCLRKCRDASNFYYSASGRNVTLYAIDSPVVDHAQFKNIRTGLSRLATDRFLSPSARSARGECAGDHGTHVAALAGGVEFGTAKNLQIVSVGAQPGCGRPAHVADILAGLHWTLEHHTRQQRKYNETRPAIATIALMLKATTQSSRMITKYVKKLTDNGVSVVVAAGNFHDNACNYVPANMEDVVTVGGAHISDGSLHAAPWAWSNWGPCVDIFAPGEDITSASPNCFECVATYSGTSIAAPMVAGLAAQYMQKYKGSSPQEVKAALIGESTTQLLDVSRYPYKTTPSRLAQSFLDLQVLKVAPLDQGMNLSQHTSY